MPLTLDQYAEYLDKRGQTWPAAPEPEPVKARPHLKRLPAIRVVTWNIYGTLLAIHGGQLYFEHPLKFMMDLALDKTLQEFKMWGAMTRKPGQPAEYLLQMYQRVYDELRSAPSPGEKFPEVLSEQVWEGIIKKLLQKDYSWDVGFYGSLNEYTRKIAYFFHASLQGTACYPETVEALKMVVTAGLSQGWIADGQIFTPTQLQRAINQQEKIPLDDLFDPELRALSCGVRARKPSERLFARILERLTERGIAPFEVLHVGNDILLDVGPARKLGMRTALYAGDKGSLRTTPEQLRDKSSRPDVLLTDLRQIAEIIPIS